MQGCERKIHFQMSKIIPIISSFISYKPLSNKTSLKRKHSWSKSNNKKMRISFIIYGTCFSLNTVITININMKYKNCPFYVQCPQGDMTVSNVLNVAHHTIFIFDDKCETFHKVKVEFNIPARGNIWLFSLGNN